MKNWFTSSPIYPIIQSFFDPDIHNLICPLMHLSVLYQLIYESIHPTIHQFIHPSNHTPVYPSIQLYTSLSIHPPVYPSNRAPVHPSITARLILDPSSVENLSSTFFFSLQKLRRSQLKPTEQKPFKATLLSFCQTSLSISSQKLLQRLEGYSIAVAPHAPPGLKWWHRMIIAPLNTRFNEPISPIDIHSRLGGGESIRYMLLNQNQ